MLQRLVPTMNRTLLYTIFLVGLVIAIRALVHIVGASLAVLRVLQLIAVGQLIIAGAYFWAAAREMAADTGSGNGRRRALREISVAAVYALVAVSLLVFAPRIIRPH